MRYYLFDEITKGEKRYIERKRLGVPQRAHARNTGVTFNELTENEKDDTIGEQIFLELYEECIIYMRRNNISSSELATDMGVTKSSVYYWRRGMKDYDKLFERLMRDKDSRNEK